MTDNDCEAFEAEQLLLKMSEMYFSGKNKILRPDVVLRGLVLSAWTKSRKPDAAQRAQNLSMSLVNIERIS